MEQFGAYLILAFGVSDSYFEGEITGRFTLSTYEVGVFPEPDLAIAASEVPR